LVGSGLAAVLYDYLATPRIVSQPIEEAVTHPDVAPGDGVVPADVATVK
jgi:hypothetical protein